MTLHADVQAAPVQRPTPDHGSHRRSVFGNAGDVKAMYEAYPYPSPVVGDTLIDDVANSLHFLYPAGVPRGMRILDAGCGTGQRLLSVARAFPGAICAGVDISDASLAVARDLAERHRVANVRFERGDLLHLDLGERFDLVVSTGVIHHLEEPLDGLRQLVGCLTADGVALVWCYHALGDRQRLLDRELLLTLWDRASGLDRGVEMMSELGLHLATQQYGRVSARAARDAPSVTLDVDAYLHPIVHAYRFEDALDLFRGAGLDWAAVHSITRPSQNALIDLGDREESDEARYFCQRGSDLFDRPGPAAAFARLERRQQLRVLEIKLQPSGFTMLGGRGSSPRRFGARIDGNLVAF